MIHWSLKTAFAVLRDAWRERPYVILTTGPSHLAHLSGYLCKRIGSTPWIMDYRDPWTTYPGSAQVYPRSYQPWLFAKLERHFLRTADAVTVVSPQWLKTIRASAPHNPDKFHLIRNGHDLDWDYVAQLKHAYPTTAPTLAHSV